MCYNERWSTIGSEGWTDINTQVVCNDLGYDVSGKNRPHTQLFTQLHVSTDKEEGSNNIRQSLSKPVYLHNVKCSSSDLSLLECGFTRYTGNINDVQDAIVVCQKCKCIYLCAHYYCVMCIHITLTPTHSLTHTHTCTHTQPHVWMVM